MTPSRNRWSIARRHVHGIVSVVKNTTSLETQAAGRHLGTAPAHEPEDNLDLTLVRRTRLRNQHAQKVARLMEHRTDLRGVYPLADFVDEAIRWTA